MLSTLFIVGIVFLVWRYFSPSAKDVWAIETSRQILITKYPAGDAWESVPPILLYFEAAELAKQHGARSRFVDAFAKECYDRKYCEDLARGRK